ncbi:hypothetical protein LIA77_05432 [Sarocladium implicatum]|nr:hypothetical protein LIA77_05432 [Sarocladium implicatum]
MNCGGKRECLMSVIHPMAGVPRACRRVALRNAIISARPARRRLSQGHPGNQRSRPASCNGHLPLGNELAVTDSHAVCSAFISAACLSSREAGACQELEPFATSNVRAPTT